MPAPILSTRTPLVDERAAVWVAGGLAPRHRSDPAAVAALRAALADDLAAVDAAARAWTRLGAGLPQVDVRVVGRLGWVRANLAAMRGALEPLRARLERRPGASTALGVQLGALLGLLSGKVLGQHVVPLGGPGDGGLIVVGPNLLALAEEHGPLAGDLRRTVLLHEVTHHLQFAAAPWLADHLRGLIADYLAHARLDRDAVAELLPRLGEVVDEIRRSGSIQPLYEAVLTAEQAAILGQAQGLMSLLEGHGNAAMREAGGAELVRDPDGVREALASRQGDVTSRVLSAVAGLELKRRQYRDGEVFVREVLDMAGVDGLNLAFRDAASLPGADEIATPRAWLDRVRVG